jgi:hypothetical protein
MSNSAVFEDDRITVELFSFQSYDRVAQFTVREKHANVGYYHIWVYFESGDRTQTEYDGGNPQREQILTVRTTHRNDKIKEIVVKRVRN